MARVKKIGHIVRWQPGNGGAVLPSVWHGCEIAWYFTHWNVDWLILSYIVELRPQKEVQKFGVLATMLPEPQTHPRVLRALTLLAYIKVMWLADCMTLFIIFSVLVSSLQRRKPAFQIYLCTCFCEVLEWNKVTSYRLLLISTLGAFFQSLSAFLKRIFWTQTYQGTKLDSVSAAKFQICFHWQFTAWVPSRLDTFHAVRVGVLWLHLTVGCARSTGQKEAVMNTVSQKSQDTFWVLCVLCILNIASDHTHKISHHFMMKAFRTFTGLMTYCQSLSLLLPELWSWAQIQWQNPDSVVLVGTSPRLENNSSSFLFRFSCLCCVGPFHPRGYMAEVHAPGHLLSWTVDICMCMCMYV